MKTQRQNSNFSQKYVRNVKDLFPITRKQEKVYLRQMKQNLDDYCDTSTVSSIEELYKEFGDPQDVVHNYFSTMDTAQFLTVIRFRRIIKRFLMCVSLIIFAFTIFYCIILYREHITFTQETAVFLDTITTDPEAAILP